jgi:hypothetical protein
MILERKQIRDVQLFCRGHDSYRGESVILGKWRINRAIVRRLDKSTTISSHHTVNSQHQNRHADDRL